MRSPLMHAAVAVLVGACASPSVTVTVSAMAPEAPLPSKTPGYESSLAALQQGDFGGVRRRADATAEEKALASALEDVEAGRFREADRALTDLAAKGPAETGNRANSVRASLLLHEQRWADLQRLAGAEGLTDLLPLARGWAKAPPERVTFQSPSAVLPASLEDVGCPFVEVRVGGRPFRFLVDTGATVTLISTDVAEAAGIAALDDPAGIGTGTTRRVSVRPAAIPRLAVGNAVFENHPCVIAETSDMKFSLLLFTRLRIEGVIGWNAIRRLDLEIDFRVPQVTVRKPSPRAVDRNLFWLNVPILRARLADGFPVLAGLDTGASESTLLPPFFAILPDAYREQLGKTREGSRRVWGAGGSERMETRTVERLSVVLDRHVLAFENLEARGRSLAVGLVPVLEFGNDIALKGTMRIDFLNGAFELGP